MPDPSLFVFKQYPLFETHKVTLLPLLPGSDCHLLRLTLATCDADSLGATRFVDGKQNCENPILEFCLDIVGIDRPREGDCPFKHAGGDFPQEPVMSLPMARCLTLLGLLHLFSVRLLTLCLFLMLVLMAEATSNRQGIYINRQFNIFWTYSRKRNIYLRSEE